MSIFKYKKPLDFFTPVSYNKTTKTAYLRRIIYTNVVMLPLGAASERSAGSSPVTRIEKLRLMQFDLHSLIYCSPRAGLLHEQFILVGRKSACIRIKFWA